jgi:uncharacterized membrane protein YdjX (TVP38/TMEM64 family)
MADFVLVRALGRDAFAARFPHVARPMDALAERLGFTLLVLLRMIPTVTFDLLSYAAAVTHVSTHRFALATLLGLLPGPLIAAAVGGGVGRGDAMLSAALTVAALAVVGVVLWRARDLLR